MRLRVLHVFMRPGLFRPDIGAGQRRDLIIDLVIAQPAELHIVHLRSCRPHAAAAEEFGRRVVVSWRRDPSARPWIGWHSPPIPHSVWSRRATIT